MSNIRLDHVIDMSHSSDQYKINVNQFWVTENVLINILLYEAKY
jgi:hypothetical protein